MSAEANTKRCNKYYEEKNRIKSLPVDDPERIAYYAHKCEIVKRHYRRNAVKIREDQEKKRKNIQMATMELATRMKEPWTKEEDAIVLLKTKKAREIAIELGRTYASILSRRNKLHGVPSLFPPKKEKRLRLADLPPDHPIILERKERLRELHRVRTTRRNRRILSLPKSDPIRIKFIGDRRRRYEEAQNPTIPLAVNHHQLWTIEDDMFLLESNHSIKEMAIKVGRTWCATAARQRFVIVRWTKKDL